ncbi:MULTISPECIES: cation:proton antiporter [unclassified Saccharothrix]|uniref:cation:proton antiporter n=1 Tax=unclassified Saccharothrix TaxID=2593673 RepID=UPI00307D5CF5
MTAATLGTLAVLLGLARVFGAAAVRLGQPAVVGEIACGLVLGVALTAGKVGLPTQVESAVDVVGQLGLVLFLFCVGARLAPKRIVRDGARRVGVEGDATAHDGDPCGGAERDGTPEVGGPRGGRAGRRVLAVLPLAAGATLVPFALGAALAVWPAARHAPAGTGLFVLFVGAAMAVTAFPVLARVLAERDLLDRSEGQRALVVAAMTDAAAWLALAVVIGGSRGGSWLLVIPFALVLPAFSRLPRRTPVAVTAVIACGAAAVTETAGLHAALGAFLAGFAVGRANTEALAPIAGLLAPLYFVRVGQRVDLSTVDWWLVPETAAVIVVAVLGKLGGGYLGARLAGHPRHDAAVFAVLMNTRGITEIVFATIGLELGVIDGAFYAVMVVMALVTTAMTGPLLDRLRVTTPERGVLA